MTVRTDITKSHAVQETRIILTAGDDEHTVCLLRDGLGLHVLDGWDDPDGRGVVLEAGRATIEVIDTPQSERLDRIEAGEHRSGHVRLAFRVQDVDAAGQHLGLSGATPLREPVTTPWGHYNQRLQIPNGVHVTLFQPEVELP